MNKGKGASGKALQMTEAQSCAVNARGGSLTLSAAAGSGKTFVLTERIAERIRQDDGGLEELLAITFTNAAADEMRSRIFRKINELLKEDPKNPKLQKQLMLLPSARISTIDSFCVSLVRENFDKLNVAPDFSIMSENEAEALKELSFSESSEELFKDGGDSFRALIEELFEADLKKLKDCVFWLHRNSKVFPKPENFLADFLSLYDPASAFESNKCVNIIRELALSRLDIMIKGADFFLDDSKLPEEEKADFPLSGDKDFKKFNENRDEIRQRLKDIKSCCAGIKEDIEKYDFDAARELSKKFRDACVRASIRIIPSQKLLKQAKEFCNNCTKSIKSKDGDLRALEKLLCEGRAEYESRLEKQYPSVKELVKTVSLLDKKLKKAKSEKNVLEFSDITLLALELLSCPKGEALARELAGQLNEILIDEYQDTNEAQNSIFKALSEGAPEAADETGKANKGAPEIVDETGKANKGAPETVVEECEAQRRASLFTVGDIKQSIYGFRQARPDIFRERMKSAEKYEPSKEKYPAKIFLSENFRSRSEICSFVNLIFGVLMSEKTGGIEYDDNEKLKAAKDFEPAASPPVELHLFDGKETKSAENLKNEGEFIASYIEDRVKEHGDSYEDFAVLLRKNNQIVHVKKALTERGIPCSAISEESILDSPEVRTTLSLLKVIDNPLLEVPLLSVLFSPLFGFGPDKAAELRLLYPKCKNFFFTLLEAEKNGDEDCIGFLESLRLYRRLSLCLPPGELIRKIYADTMLPELAESLPGGRQRAADLMLFAEHADSFASADSLGISAFLRFIESSKAPSSPASASADAVRLMTVHKSKGLEFKYCILAGTNSSAMNSRSGCAKHRLLGLGFKYTKPSEDEDSLIYTEQNTLSYAALSEDAKRMDDEEELRILYVALTRAKEKLLICGTLNLESCDFLLKPYELENGKIHPAAFAKAPKRNGPLKLILAASATECEELKKRLSAKQKASCEKEEAADDEEKITVFDGAVVYIHGKNDAACDKESAADIAELSDSAKAAGDGVNAEESDSAKAAGDGVKAEESAANSAELPDDVEKDGACSEKDEEAAADRELVKRLKERLEFRYPFAELSATAAKQTASKLSLGSDDEAAVKAFFDRFACAKPAFYKKAGLTAAQRGTALHKFMQYARLKELCSDSSLFEEELERLKEKGFLSEAEAKVVDRESIIKFTKSRLAEEMFNSKKLMREKEFTVFVPLRELKPDIQKELGEEKILLQGMADCVYEYKDNYTVADYKTDSDVTREELISRHSPQLFAYAEALTKCLERPVDRLLIYSFFLNDTVEIPFERKPLP